MGRENFTTARIGGYRCDAGKQQTIFWDSKSPGLGLRVTATGSRSYIFESRLFGKTLRLTIGDPRAWDLGRARIEANQIKTLIDRGIDPRALRAEEQAAYEAKSLRDAAGVATVAEAWEVYLADRKPFWGDRHYQDHVKKSQAGGQISARGTRGRGVTVPGPLFPLMSKKIRDLDSSVIEAWAAVEGTSRPTAARLSLRLLKGFLSWCSEQPRYSSVTVANAASTKRTRELLGKPKAKRDSLQREQLQAWFGGVQALPNKCVAAYLQTLLLTGARPAEILAMQWGDVGEKWNVLTIRDKVEGDREIPLTPYVASLLKELPRRSAWVFSSNVTKPGEPPKPIGKPHKAHNIACLAGGIEKLTLHGLRRSFKNLSDLAECPVGVAAQLMGHKPSATAEKHYTVRPMSFLRTHHERIERWILEEGAFQAAANKA